MTDQLPSSRAETSGGPAEDARYFSRELSWLEFNQRVMELAADAEQPLLERLKFLAITGSNLDEFCMVRIGSLKMQAEQNPRATDLTGRNVLQQIRAVLARSRKLQGDQYAILHDQLEPALGEIGIQRIDLHAAGERHQQAADGFVESDALPVLSPQIIDPEKPFPLLPGLQVHLGVRLEPTEKKGVPWDYGVIPLGRVLSRIVSLPSESGYSYALLEDVVRESVDQFFPGRVVAECVPIRLTRNADVELREDSAADLMAGMGEVLENRKASSVVRLEVAAGASAMIKEFLRPLLELEVEDVVEVAGPLDLTYLFQLSSLQGFDAHRDPGWPPQGHPLIDPRESMFENISRQDLLMVHPYQRFDPVVRLIEEAAADPDVLAIKQVLYRTSRRSAIVAALMRAAERGKYVTAVVELKARFDEARNIEWAREMEHAGVQVIYGVKGLKTHAKVCIIVRRETQGIVRYVHFGTGNYNEATAQLYGDISLLTCNDEMGADASAFFNALTGASQVQQFHHLDVAPVTLRKRLLSLIDAEAARAREGQRGKIYAKLNALVDAAVIEALYQASQAGVQIRLNIRGVCCLRPGVPGVSENIEVVSIVDRYLEHARILSFYQGGEEAMYISSADWMPRNLDRRVELLVPILDAACRKKLMSILDTYFQDNCFSWKLRSDGTYQRQHPARGNPPARAQALLYQRAKEEFESVRSTPVTTFQPHQAAGRKEEGQAL